MIIDFRQIEVRLKRQWERGLYLKAIASGEQLFPLEVPVKSPTADEMVENFTEVQNWIKEYRKGCEAAGAKLVFKEINHRRLGRNTIPDKVIFDDIDRLAGFLSKKREYSEFEKAFKILTISFPELVCWAEKHPFDLIKSADVVKELILIAKWLIENPVPRIYLRQLTLPGVDTKFIELHKKLLSQWFDILLDPKYINQSATGGDKFEERYGFLGKPLLVRYRILDPNYNLEVFSDITVSSQAFAHWAPPVRRVIVVENDITALSFPMMAETLLIFGRGYSFDTLATAKWLQDKELWYWGDIDTHGFAILNQFKKIFPHATSFLMDRETLLSHLPHCGIEKTPATAGSLPFLDKAESELYLELKTDRIGANLRLEQEFICYDRIISWCDSISP